MTFTIDRQQSSSAPIATVVCQGRFGPGAAAALWATLESMPDVTMLHVDVTAVESIDTHGLRALLGAAHRLGEENKVMTLLGISADIDVTLRAVGLHRWAALQLLS